MKINISVIGLILGTLVNMGLGALWYSNALFAKPWMKEAGITKEDIDASSHKMNKIYGLTGVGAFVTSFFLGVFTLNIGIDTLLEGSIWALILWIGTHLATIIKNWGFENRTWKLGWINHGYDLVVYILVVSIYVILN